MKTSRILFTAVVLSLALGGCRKKPAPAPAPEPAPAPAATQPQPQPPAPPATDPNREREEAIRRAREILERRVHFDFDDASIRPDARAILDEKIPVLRQYPDVRILVEGHCDERGSNEYNLALGSRRAESIKRYLVDAGISADRIETISYGEERPLVAASNEEAWAQNRRGEFRILSGLGG